MRAVLGPLALAACLAVAACGSKPADPAAYRSEAAAACAGASTGASALDADGRAPQQRIEAAMQRAVGAGRALAQARPPEALRAAHDEAVHALQGQAARLRAVRDQLERGSRPAPVLSAARASLEDGDARTRDRLKAVGVDCAALVATQPDP